MNKAKFFVLTLVAGICICLTAVIVLTYSIATKFNWDLNIDLNPVSYQQVLATQEQKYVVVDIVDGDTIKVMEDGEKKTIRLIGIDAPEVKTKDCKYQEATNELSELILNKNVVLEADSTQTDLDKYGRQLRYVFIDGKNANLQMVADGLATEYKYNKTYKYRDSFLQAQSSAKTQQMGIWSSECSLK